MYHSLKICVGGPPPKNDLVRCHHVSVREKLLRALLGEHREITVIVPGSSVRELDIRELPVKGGDGCA